MKCIHCEEGQEVSTFHGSTVCDTCGREKPPELVTSLTPRDWITEPIMHIYSRKKRFKNLLESLLWPAFSQKDNRMVKYLYQFAPFATKKDLLAQIKRSTLSDKRYSSIHFLCKTYVQNYLPPPQVGNIHVVVKRLLNRFGDIEFGFSHLFQNVQFFNYAWLLTQLLKEAKLDNHVNFVKILKCKQRVKYYTTMLTKITNLLDSSDRFHTMIPL